MDTPQVNLAVVQEAVAEAVPDRPAILHGDVVVTYAELTTRSRQVANALLDLGVPTPLPRSQVPAWETGQGHLAIVARNRREWIEAQYGAYKARLAPFNVNYRYTAAEMGEVLGDAAPVAVVYESWVAPVIATVRDRLPEGCHLLQLPDDSDEGLLPGAFWFDEIVDKAPDERPALEWSPDDIYLLYTGGTTGRPKGVVWRHADIWMAAVKGSRHVVTATAEDELKAVAEAAAGSPARYILALPPFMHGAAQWLVMAAMHGGDTLVIQEAVDHLDPVDVWRTVERHKVNALLMVGDAFGRPLLDELERGNYDASSVVMLVTGGAVTSPTLKEKLLAKLPQAFVVDAGGSSESGSFLTHASSAAGVSTGTFVPGPGAAIVSDDRSRFLSVGDEEIGWLGRSGSIPLGYLHDPEKTRATFVEIDGTRVSIPGDRARWQPDGTIALLGRESVTINTGGEKVFAEEVEQALMSHPAIRDALAVGRPHERWGQEVVALVVDAAEASATDAELVAHCRETLAGYKVPKAVIRVDAIRRSPAGKPDYAWGREQAATAGS